VYDGKDASQVLLGTGPSKHDFLFFYKGDGPPTAVRHGKWSVTNRSGGLSFTSAELFLLPTSLYVCLSVLCSHTNLPTHLPTRPLALASGRKAHWTTGPGLGGCEGCKTLEYKDPPLLFDVEQDPSEACVQSMLLGFNCPHVSFSTSLHSEYPGHSKSPHPIPPRHSTRHAMRQHSPSIHLIAPARLTPCRYPLTQNNTKPARGEVADAVAAIQAAYAQEVATFVYVLI